MKKPSRCRLDREDRKPYRAEKLRRLCATSMGEDKAPKLVAKGAGVVAEKIIKTAEEAGVPIHEDPDLLALLMTLNVGELIPPELYMAVAEVLAFIYRMNRKVISDKNGIRQVYR